MGDNCNETVEVTGPGGLSAKLNGKRMAEMISLLLLLVVIALGYMSHQTMQQVSVATGGVTGLLRNATGKAISLAGKRIGMNKIADAMASSEGRKALQTLSNPKASPQAIIAAFTTVEQ